MKATKAGKPQAVYLAWEGRRSTYDQTPTQRRWVTMKVN